MSPEATKQYLTLAALQMSYDVDTRGVDAVSAPFMRKILKG